MFFSRKTAAAAAVVGSLAAICLGVTHAYGEGNPGDCPTAMRLDVSCVQHNETYIDKDGTQVIKQDQQCSTTDRPHVVVEQEKLLTNDSVKEGLVMDCSNTAKLPDGWLKKPHNDV
ncbi:hypothetical protein OG985_43645 [Streptomyces sp. NBC_00289]|uniref:hypothetical protein n=1 Tax=Streptomyces sp. NBC_00289 TaxID=2975703 RepID=UPI00325363EB